MSLSFWLTSTHHMLNGGQISSYSVVNVLVDQFLKTSPTAQLLVFYHVLYSCEPFLQITDKNSHFFITALAECKFIKYTASSEVDVEPNKIEVIAVLTGRFPDKPALLLESNREIGDTQSVTTLKKHFDQCVDHCANIESRLEALQRNGDRAAYVPFLSQPQWVDTICNMSPKTIVILSDIDGSIRDFNEMQSTVLHRSNVLVVEDRYGPMVKLDPGMFFDLQSSKIPRNPNAASAQPRSYSNPEDRYRLLVELINQNLSIKEIAARMNLSAPSIYLMRSEHRDQLDKDTTKGMRAMRFHKKDR